MFGWRSELKLSSLGIVVGRFRSPMPGNLSSASADNLIIYVTPMGIARVKRRTSFDWTDCRVKPGNDDRNHTRIGINT
jgi:hypothetical protein